MKKKQKKQVVVGIVLVIALIIFLNATGNLRMPFAVGEVSDLSILSISKTTINGEPAIRIYATANGGAELLDIDWGSSYLDSKLKENNLEDFDATKPITGSIKVGQQSLEFPYASTGKIIYKSVRKVNIGTFSSCSYTNCKNAVSSNEDILEYERDPIRCFCLVGSEKADVGKWSSITKGDYPITFSIDGLGSKTLSRDSLSPSINEANIGSYAKIKFQGFLDSYDSISKPSYTPYLYLNKINLIQPTSFSPIEIALNNLRTNVNYGQYDVDTYNSLLNRYFVDNYNSYTQESYIESASRSVSGVKIFLDKPISYPTFTIDLNAEKVGIIKQVGQPDNLYCDSFNFLANTLGETSCSVKNEGGPGSFMVDLSSCSGVSAFVVGGNNLGGFNKEQTKSFKINLQGTTDNQNGESVNCNVKVYDLNEPSNYDTYRVSGKIEYNPGGKCSPIGKLICDEQMENLLECKSSGNYDLKSECEFGCTYGNDGKALCKYSPDNETIECPPITIIPAAPPIIKNDVTIPDFICKIKVFFRNLFAGVLALTFIFKVIVSAIALLMTLFFSKEQIVKIKEFRKNKALVWVLAFLITGAVGIIIYLVLFTWVFWVLTIGLIVFNIIRRFIIPF